MDGEVVREGDFITSPIVHSNADPHMHHFKICCKDVVLLRVFKEEIIELLKKKDFDVVDQTGWHEE